MLSNDLHLRLHNRHARQISGIVSAPAVPAAANPVAFRNRDIPRTQTLPPSVGILPVPEPTRVMLIETEIEAQWRALLRLWPCEEEVPGCPPSPRPLIEAAMERPELRRLYPVTHAYTLCFRRTPDALTTRDLPSAAPIGFDCYHAFAPGAFHPLCEGSAEEVVDRLVEVVLGFGC